MTNNPKVIYRKIEYGYHLLAPINSINVEITALGGTPAFNAEVIKELKATQVKGNYFSKCACCGTLVYNTVLGIYALQIRKDTITNVVEPIIKEKQITQCCRVPIYDGHYKFLHETDFKLKGSCYIFKDYKLFKGYMTYLCYEIYGGILLEYNGKKISNPIPTEKDFKSVKLFDNFVDDNVKIILY